MIMFLDVTNKYLILKVYQNIRSKNFKKQIKITSVLDFLDKIIEENSKTEQCLDFFLEDYYLIDKNKIKNGGNQSNIILQLIRDKYDECSLKTINKKNCKNNFRFHYWDIRKIYVYTKKKIDYNGKYHPLEEAAETLDLYDDKVLKFNNFEEIFSTYLFLIGYRNNKKQYLMGREKINNLYYFILDPFKFIGNEIEEEYFGKEKIDMFLEKPNNFPKIARSIIELRKKMYLNISQIESVAFKIKKQMKNIDKKYLKQRDIINYWKYRFKKYFDEKKNIVDEKNICKLKINKNDGIWDLLMMSLTETYTISRMFRKFENKRNIKNCEGNKSLKNIFYYGGNTHAVNITHFLFWNFDIKPKIIKNIKEFYNNENKIDQCIQIKNFKPFNLNSIYRLFFTSSSLVKSD